MLPLYEFICQRCALAWDVLRPIADRDRVALCPRCLSKRTSRNRVSPFALPRHGAEPPPTLDRSPAPTTSRTPDVTLENLVLEGVGNVADAIKIGRGRFVRTKDVVIGPGFRVGVDNEGVYEAHRTRFK